MFQIERAEKILDYINEHKKVHVIELSEIFNVSKVTIRRDLEDLAQKGLIVKTHGGAVSIENRFSYEIPTEAKENLNVSAKRIIGKKAATLINDNDIILLDAGTTTLEVAKNITQSNITVITHDIKIANELAHKKNINLIVTGGSLLNTDTYTLVGNRCEKFIRSLKVNKTFLGCDALDIESGLSNRSIEEIEIKKAMMDSAQQSILVTDSEKFGKRVFCHLCQISDIKTIVTEKISEQYMGALNEYGVEIIIADTNKQEE
ncbi:MAG: DeoR/GlpR family DNA-binding transcription regulator [Clostridia bacterium]|nr:DeoR/GlpR family DNA-binding transcription regulator [Clostridia bacterium]